MCFGWCIRSNYPELPLPENLASPRAIFFNEADPTPEKTFFLAVFLAMRKDLVEYNEWITELFLLDQPPPLERYRTPEQIQYFRSIRYCQICGTRFGAKKWSARSQSFYTIKRCFDHDHILSNSGGLRGVCCQVSM